MNITEELREFYDTHAQKYADTRNKHRPDADMILDEIRKSGKKTVRILEFGCGSGRLLAHLTTSKGITIQYTGVDISKNLLDIAKKHITGKAAVKHITAHFVCDDIAHHLSGLEQESFDFVIGIASFQHIPTIKERFFVIKNIYRILRFDGALIMTNRSFSSRFLRNYQKEILRSLWKYIISLGKHQWNDLMIPWTHGTKSAQRFYHIFTLAELRKIISLSGFVIEKLCHISKGTITASRESSQNSFVVARKTAFLH